MIFTSIPFKCKRGFNLTSTSSLTTPFNLCFEYQSMASLPSSDVLRNVVDVHCHPTDALSISSESMDKLGITICAMSSRTSDQTLVRGLAQSYPDKVIPCFGLYIIWALSITLLHSSLRVSSVVLSPYMYTQRCFQRGSLSRAIRYFQWWRSHNTEWPLA